MALSIFDDLTNFAGLPSKIQDRIKRAQNISNIDYMRRTRSQQAFLDSVQNEIERGTYNAPSPSPTGKKVIVTERQIIPSVKVNFPQVRQEIAYRPVDADGNFDPTVEIPSDYYGESVTNLQPVNEFSTPLYPLARGQQYQTEMIIPSQLDSFQDAYGEINQRPFIYGALRDYPDVPRTGKNPNIPRRLQTEEDAVVDAAFEQFKDKLNAIPSARVARGVSVGDTLQDIYQTIINKTPSPAYMPGFEGTTISGSDVPRILLKQGVDSDDVFYRPDNKGRTARNNPLFKPGEIDLTKTLANDAAQQRGLITQVKFPPYTSNERKQEFFNKWISLNNMGKAPYINTPISYIDGESLAEAGIIDRVGRMERVDPRTGNISEEDIRLNDELPNLVRIQTEDPTNPKQTIARLVDRNDPNLIKEMGDDPGRFLQAAGWAAVGSGSGALQNTFARQLALGIENPAVITETGPEYLARVNQSRTAAQATETTNRALRDEYGRLSIDMRRELAKRKAQNAPVQNTTAEVIIPPVMPGAVSRVDVVEGSLEPLTDRINASLAKDPRLDVTAPGLYYLGGKDHALAEYPVVRSVPGTTDYDLNIGVPPNAGLAFPAGLTRIIQDPTLLRTQSLPYQPGRFYRDTSKTPVESTEQFGSEAIETDSEVKRRPALLAFDVNPEDPMGLPEGDFARRMYKPGDATQFVNRLSQGQQALRGRMQSILDPIAAPTVVRGMDPITATQRTIDYLEEQIQRLEPFAQQGRQQQAGPNQFTTYAQQSDQLRAQQNQLTSLLRDHEVMEDYKQQFDDNLRTAYTLTETPEVAERVKLATDQGVVSVPLADYMDSARQDRTVQRFGLGMSANQPSLVPRSNPNQGLFEYGARNTVSIISPQDENPKLFLQLKAIDPDIEPGDVRQGLRWREIRKPGSRAVEIELIDPGQPVLDASGKRMRYSPDQMIGYDSTVGPYTDVKLRSNPDSNRARRRGLQAAAAAGYTPLSIDRNVPIKYGPVPGKPLALPENRRTSYSVTPQKDLEPALPTSTSADRTLPFSQLGWLGTWWPQRPISTSADRTLQLGIPGLNLSLNPQSDAPARLQPAGVLSYGGYSPDLARATGIRQYLRTPPESYIGDLSQVDSLSTANPADKAKLFGLADSLRISGTSLMDSSNDYQRLKDDIKSALASRYPDRFGAPGQAFRTDIAPGFAEPAEIRAANQRRVSGQVVGDTYQPGYDVANLQNQMLDPQQIMLSTVGRERNRSLGLTENAPAYTLRRIAAQMKQNPETAQNIFSYLDNQSKALDEAIQDSATQLSSLDTLQASPERIQAFKSAIESELASLTSQKQNLAFNTRAIRQMMGY